METFDLDNEKEVEALRSVRSSFTMSEKEKAAIRGNLLTYMQQHPVRLGTREKSAWSFFALPMPLRVLQSASMLMAVLFVISASTAVAAEEALPGEVLYAMKVNITEPLRGFLAVSAEGRAHWQASLVDRRLEEATELSVQGRLDEKKAAALSDKIAASAERAESEANKLNKRGRPLAAVDVQSKVAASLGARAKVFARVKAADTSDDQEYVEPFAGAIKVRAEVAGAATAKTAATIEQDSNMPSVRLVAQKKRVAERKISTASELLERRSIDAKARLDAESTITAAVEAFKDGQLALSANMNGKAYVKFQEAEGLAEQASAVIRASQRLRGRLLLPDETETQEQREGSTSQQQNEIPNPASGRSTGESSGEAATTVDISDSAEVSQEAITTDVTQSIEGTITTPSTVVVDEEEDKDEHDSIRTLLRGIFTSQSE